MLLNQLNTQMALDLHKILDTGISKLNLSISDDIQQQLIQFVELLHKWNKIYNLTSVRNKKQMVSVHLLDSLAISPYVSGNKILDVGAGAGLPGIVLALCFPKSEFALIDSNRKKTRFMNQAVTELGLKNVQVEYTRIETYECETSFDQIVSRAYTSLEAFVKNTSHLANAQTQYLGMKGQFPEQEIAELADGYNTKIIPLNVPDVEGQRHLIIMTSKINF